MADYVAYCVKCKTKKEIVDAIEETMKNGRRAIKGKCPTCGVVMFKILGRKTVSPEPEASPSRPEADSEDATSPSDGPSVPAGGVPSSSSRTGLTR